MAIRVLVYRAILARCAKRTSMNARPTRVRMVGRVRISSIHTVVDAHLDIPASLAKPTLMNARPHRANLEARVTTPSMDIPVRAQWVTLDCSVRPTLTNAPRRHV